MILLYLTQKEIQASCCHKIWVIFQSPVKYKLCADHPWCICGDVTRCINSTTESSVYLVYTMYNKFWLKTISYLLRKWKSNSEFQKKEWIFPSVEQNRSWYGPPGSVTQVTAHFLLVVQNKRGVWNPQLRWIIWDICVLCTGHPVKGIAISLNQLSLDKASHTKHPSTVLRQSTEGPAASETMIQDRDWAAKTEGAVKVLSVGLWST